MVVGATLTGVGTALACNVAATEWLFKTGPVEVTVLVASPLLIAAGFLFPVVLSELLKLWTVARRVFELEPGTTGWTGFKVVVATFFIGVGMTLMVMAVLVAEGVVRFVGTLF